MRTKMPKALLTYFDVDNTLNWNLQTFENFQFRPMKFNLSDI